MECKIQRERYSESDQRNDELQRKHAGAKKQNRLLREDGRKGARLLAEGEQHDVVEHDAARDRRHQPAIRAPFGKRPHEEAFDHETKQSAQQERHGDRNGNGQPSRIAKV